MKYALLFAATASAYEAYGGYGAQSSSVPAKVSSTPYGGGYDYKPVTSSKPVVPASKPTPCSVGKNGYTTVNVGYGKQPVTVTAQHQSYPTCVAASYDGKSCDMWSDDKYVSTTVNDYNGKVVTVTKKEEYVTIYHEKKTITHTATPTMKGYGAAPTPAKNGTGVWYELYEKIYLCEYQNMGKNAMTGYPGSGMCQKCDDEQPIVYRECKSGKCTDEKKTLNYGKPKEEVKVYEKPGVYSVPAKTITVYNQPTSGSKLPEYKVYSYPPKVITITVPNQPYTCTYEIPKQTPSKTPSKNEGYPSKTPSNNYGYATPTPNKPSNNYGDYPVYDSKKNTTSVAYGNGYGSYPTPTPATSSKPVYGDYGYGNKGSSSIPSKPSSTPCSEDKIKPTPTPYQPSYDNSYNDNNKPKPSPTPSKPSYDNGSNGYGADYKATPTPANYNNNAGYGDNAKPTPSPAYNGGNNYNNGAAYDTKPTPTPVGSYPADKSAGYSSTEQYGKTNGGYGTYKRSSVISRRKAVAEAQEAKRAIVL